MESAEEVKEVAGHYDALHHTESQGGLTGSFAAQAALSSGPRDGQAPGGAPPVGPDPVGSGEAAGEPPAPSTLHPGVGPVRARLHVRMYAC